MRAQPEAGDQATATMTDAKGNFKLVNLQAGSYKLRAERNAYLRSAHGAKRADGQGSVVSVAAGQELKDLQIRMLPFEVLAGTVREADGEPLVGVEVVASRQVFEQGRRQVFAEGDPAHTDDLGQFRIPNLPPGKYYVLAKPPDSHKNDRPTLPASPKDAPVELLVQSLYPGVLDSSAARLIDLGAGARLTGVDLVMLRSRGVRVTVKASAPAKVHPHITLHPRREGSVLRRTIDGEVLEDGAVEFRNVPPGSYTVDATVQTELQADTSNPPAGFVIINGNREAPHAISPPCPP